MPVEPPSPLAGVLAPLLHLAREKHDFRALCLTDPHRAWREATGTELPEGFRLRIQEQGTPELVVVLPDPVLEPRELSCAELEQVAGGKKSYNPFQIKF